MINTNVQKKFLVAAIAQGDAVFKNPFLNESPLEGITGLNFIQKFLPAAVGLIFVVGFIFFLFMMLIGAIGWISSGGDKTAIEAARGKITNAILGTVILISVFALIKLIEYFFGINILTIDIGPLIIQ